MKTGRILSGIALLAASACTLPNEFNAPDQSQNFVTAAHVLDQARCEVSAYLELTKDKKRLLSFDFISYTFALKAIDTGGAANGATVSFPDSASVLSLVLKGGPSSTKTSDISFQVVQKPYERVNCPAKFEGDLGLTRWLEEMEDLAKKTDITPTGVKQTVIFNLAHDGSGTPKVDRTTGDVTRSLSTTVSGKRVNEHKIIVTLAKNDPPKAKKQQAAIQRVQRQQALEILLTDE